MYLPCGQPNFIFPSARRISNDSPVAHPVITQEHRSAADTASSITLPSLRDISKVYVPSLQRNIQLPSLTSTITTETEVSAPTTHACNDISADLSSSRVAQEIFYSDPSVLYASLHAENDYPCMISVFTSDSGHFPPIDFTGAVTEKGIGEGVNTNFNNPLPRDTQDDDYCTVLRKAIKDIRRFDPAYLLLRFCTLIYGRDDTDHTFY